MPALTSLCLRLHFHLPSRRVIHDVSIVASAAQHGVCACTAIQRVIALQRNKRVIRSIADDHVVQRVSVPLIAADPVSVRLSRLSASVQVSLLLTMSMPSPLLQPLCRAGYPRCKYHRRCRRSRCQHPCRRPACPCQPIPSGCCRYCCR